MPDESTGTPVAGGNAPAAPSDTQAPQGGTQPPAQNKPAPTAPQVPTSPATGTEAAGTEAAGTAESTPKPSLKDLESAQTSPAPGSITGDQLLEFEGPDGKLRHMRLRDLTALANRVPDGADESTIRFGTLMNRVVKGEPGAYDELIREVQTATEGQGQPAGPNQPATSESAKLSDEDRRAIDEVRAFQASITEARNERAVAEMIKAYAHELPMVSKVQDGAKMILNRAQQLRQSAVATGIFSTANPDPAVVKQIFARAMMDVEGGLKMFAASIGVQPNPAAAQTENRANPGPTVVDDQERNGRNNMSMGGFRMVPVDQRGITSSNPGGGPNVVPSSPTGLPNGSAVAGTINTPPSGPVTADEFISGIGEMVRSMKQ